MDWLRRVLRLPASDKVRHAAPAPSPALAVARARHRALLSRADHAIQEAMDHADEAFGTPAPKRRRDDT